MKHSVTNNGPHKTKAISPSRDEDRSVNLIANSQSLGYTSGGNNITVLPAMWGIVLKMTCYLSYIRLLMVQGWGAGKGSVSGPEQQGTCSVSQGIEGLRVPLRVYKEPTFDSSNDRNSRMVKQSCRVVNFSCYMRSSESHQLNCFRNRSDFSILDFIQKLKSSFERENFIHKFV